MHKTTTFIRRGVKPPSLANGCWDCVGRPVWSRAHLATLGYTMHTQHNVSCAVVAWNALSISVTSCCPTRDRRVVLPDYFCLPSILSSTTWVRFLYFCLYTATVGIMINKLILIVFLLSQKVTFCVAVQCCCCTAVFSSVLQSLQACLTLCCYLVCFVVDRVSRLSSQRPSS